MLPLDTLTAEFAADGPDVGRVVFAALLHIRTGISGDAADLFEDFAAQCASGPILAMARVHAGFVRVALRMVEQACGADTNEVLSRAVADLVLAAELRRDT